MTNPRYNLSPTCLNTEKDIKPPTCQETSLKCAHASDALCNRSNCCAVCVVPIPVLSSSPSLFSLPHSCSARVLRSTQLPHSPWQDFKIKLRKLSNASVIKNSSTSTSGVWVIYTQPSHPCFLLEIPCQRQACTVWLDPLQRGFRPMWGDGSLALI